MPGIAGIVYPDAFQIGHLVSPMLETLEHRGKKGKDLFVFKNMEVGIQGSHLTHYHNKVAALDGLLYHSQELKKILMDKGYHAANATDTELILFAYEVWESSFLEHIQGEFALFLIDQQKERLLLARDRIGKRPLYWYHDQNNFIFASELKTILKSGLVPQTLALDSFATYLYFGYIPQDMSAIQNINKLLPSYALHLYRNHSKNIVPYWSYSECFLKKRQESYEEVLHNVNYLLEEAVKERIPNQKSLGCFLSGGIGSASIACYLKKLAQHKELSSYTVAFKDESEEDLFMAKEVAKGLSIPHQYEVLTPNNCLENLVKIFWYLDEPQADPNVIATWKLASLAESQKIIFSGMGSDELLAGHNRYTIVEQQKNYFNWLTQKTMPLLKHSLLPFLLLFSRNSAFKLLQQSRTNPWQLDYLNQNAIFTDEIRKKAAPRVSQLFDPHVFLHKFHHLFRISSPVASFLYFDVKTRLPDSFIFQYEKILTAHHLNWRTPFLDKNLIEYLAGIPEPERLQENETSHILKSLLKDTVPKNFLNRPKRTRKTLLSTWVESAGIQKLFQKLTTGSLVEAGLISEKWLKNQLKDRENLQQAFPYLWSILAYECWFRLFINRSITSKPPEISIEELLNE